MQKVTITNAKITRLIVTVKVIIVIFYFNVQRHSDVGHSDQGHFDREHSDRDILIGDILTEHREHIVDVPCRLVETKVISSISFLHIFIFSLPR